MSKMMQRKRWDELSTTQKATIRALGAVQIALLVAALWDIGRRSDEEINGSKRLWRLVAFVNFVGPLAYFMFGRKR